MSDLAETVKRLRKLTEARAAYLAVSNPDDVNDVLDALERLERERVAYGAVIERQHARITSLEAALAAVTTERRAPEAARGRTLWAICKLPDGMLQECMTSFGGMVVASTDKAAIARVAGRCDLDVVAFTEAQHPTPSQGTTPEKEGE